MSENYPSDVKLNDNPDGTVSFATEVVATIAGLAATEVEGVVSMVSPSSGFADMFSRKNSRNFTKGVRIDLDGTKVSVDITIVVDYGSPIPDVARSIQENVKKAIETMSGLEVQSVNVRVNGISFEREQRAVAELDEQHRKMLERMEEKAAESEVYAEQNPEEDTPIEEELDEELDEEAETTDEVMEVQPVLFDSKDDEDDALEPEDAAFYEDSAEASEDADEAQDSYDYAASYSEAIDALHDEADEVLEDDDIPEVVED